MRYLGLKLNKVSAEKFKEPSKGEIKVNSNFNLGSAEKEKTPSDLKNPVFGFNFNYSLEYGDSARIEFNGVVYLELSDPKVIKEIEKTKKTMDDNLKKAILEIVFARTHVESLHLEEKLGLPFHIQSPRVTLKEE